MWRLDLHNNFSLKPWIEKNKYTLSFKQNRSIIVLCDDELVGLGRALKQFIDNKKVLDNEVLNWYIDSLTDGGRYENIFLLSSIAHGVTLTILKEELAELEKILEEFYEKIEK